MQSTTSGDLRTYREEKEWINGRAGEKREKESERERGLEGRDRDKGREKQSDRKIERER